MEKEKNEIESEINQTVDSEPNMKQGDSDKADLESLKLNASAECEDVMVRNKEGKEENDVEKLSSAASEEEAIHEGVDSKDDNNRVPAVGSCEFEIDVDVQLEQKNSNVQSTEKMSLGSCKSSSDSGGVRNGDTSEVTDRKDKEPSAEDEVPVLLGQSSQPKAESLITGSYNNSTSVLSSVSNVRSTRSQNPEFLARHRHFLHKLHLTSNNVTDEELLTDEESTTSKATSRSSGSVQTETNCSSVVDSVAVRRKRERSASSGTLSPRIPSPGVVSMIGGSVSGNNSGSSSPAGSQLQPLTKKRRNTRTDSAGTQQSPVPALSPVLGASTDRFCWLCHKDGVVINCETCPRVYHLRCIQLEAAPTEDWVCPECITIVHAENTDTRSRAMKLLSLDHLCNLLKYAVSRMKMHSGAEPFWKAVDVTEFPQYREYVAHPMDLSLLERNIKRRMYGSTEAFVADTKWVLHNCIIFNTYQSRLTGVAKVLVKICKQEMSEIENCPDCYLNAHTRKDSWFIEVCRKPHVLVWAKLKGFPFWPAKVMRTNKEGMVDVRFFGAHDRAWVPIRECFLYSKSMPASARNKKRNNLDACIQEVEQHTKKLREKFGVFNHAPFRTHFDPAREREQLHMLLPAYSDDDEGQPSSKRIKFLGGGYKVRTHHHSGQSERKARERNKTQTSDTDDLNTTVESDKSGVKRSRGEKRKLWGRDVYSEDEKRTSRSCRRASVGSSVYQWNSSSSEDSEKSDEETQQDGGSSIGAEGSSKSASLIEWSKFEESAAKLSVVVDGGGNDDDKLNIAPENRNLRDGDEGRERVLPCNGAKGREGETDFERSEVEKSARVTAKVVKKVLAGSSIADKLQEKLLRLERSSEDIDVTPEVPVISESTPHEKETYPEVEKKTENGLENSEDSETSSVSAKKSDAVNNLNLEMSCGRTKRHKDGDDKKDSEVSDSSVSEEKRERSESPVVNKTSCKAEPRRYGKQYSPRVVLYNLVLPYGKLLHGKVRSVTNDTVSVQKPRAKEEKCPLSPAERKQTRETSPEEQNTKNNPSVEDNGKTSCSESLVQNRLKVSVVCKTNKLHGSESIGKRCDVVEEESIIKSRSQSCSFPSSRKLGVVDTDKLNVLGCEVPKAAKVKVVVSDCSSESGDSDIVTDSSKRTPEHGYSKCSNVNFVENGTKMLEPSKVQDTEFSEQKEVVVERNVEHVQSSESTSEPVQEKVSVLEPLQETLKEPEAVQSSREEVDVEKSMDTKPASEEVTASESPPDDRGAICGSVSKNIVSSSLSSSSDENLVPVEKRSEGVSSPEKANANNVPQIKSVEQSADKVSESTSKAEMCTKGSVDGGAESVADSDSCKDNSEVSIKLNTPQNTVLKVYPGKTSKALDKKIKDCKMSELSKTDALLGCDVTVTPASVVGAATEQESVADKTGTTDDNSIADRKIKEEPLDPDEFVAESSSASTSTLSSAQSSAKTSPELKLHSSLTEKKETDGDMFNKGKGITGKKLPLSVLESKERLASNESPSSVSEKDGIFPSLFLDPSITITVINDKLTETLDMPILGKSSVSNSDISVNELRASVNLSKDISLTVVGAGQGGHSSSAKGVPSGAVTPLEKECDNESGRNDSHHSSMNAASVSAQNAVMGQSNANKQKKQKLSAGNDCLQARSRARKSFPNRPVFPNVKVKSHPELVNGVGTSSNKSSVLRRNSVGTNSNSSDSRRSSYGTSPQEFLMSAQQLGDASGSDNNSNNPGSAMVVLPHVLGNPTTNHIQALRTVNSNIGAPSHVVNGGHDIMSSRMMQVPHNQPPSVGNGTRISPAGQGSGTVTGASRLLPQLQPRPPGPLLSQHPPSAPSEAGPVSAELNRHAHKLSDFLRTTVEEILRDLSNIGSPEATIKSLQIELEKLQWRHNQEMAEMKHNTDLIVMEMRASMESERQRAVAETIRQCELEKQRAVEETKKKQWCTNCGKEALFYCCWNTSYCDYPCQQRHWPQHMSTCAQNTQQGGEGSAREGDLLQQSKPQTSGGSSSNKSMSSQQHQPWLDSVPLFKPATSSAGNMSLLSYRGLCKKSGSPSPSLTYQVGDEDYDNNNNSYEASQQRDGRQETDLKESSAVTDLSRINMDGHQMQKKRKRCGQCKGCTTVGNCGECAPCKSTRTHQVCRQRRCSNLQMETALGVPSPAIKRSHINVQQKLQQVVSNGPNVGKPPVGPPPSYSGTVMAQTQRNMGAAVGRLASQYSGLVPMARPANIQVSGYTSSQPSTTASASLTTSTTGTPHATYICNVPWRPTWGRIGSPATTAETYGITVSTTTPTYGIHCSPTTLLPVTGLEDK